MRKTFRSLIIYVLTTAARIVLRRHQPKIIAVTGSVGKTATKDAIYTAMRSTFRVRKSEKSFNSEIGVPLTILGLPTGWSNPLHWVWLCCNAYLIALFGRNYPEWLVLEVGVDTPGDMQRVTSWLKPDIVVLTRLPDVPVHVEHFASPQAVVAEKLVLVDALQPDGILVANLDDIQIQEVAKQVPHTVAGYARYAEAQYQLRSDRTIYFDDRPVGVTFALHHNGEEISVTADQVIGMQLVYIYAAAMVTAHQCGVALATAAEALATNQSPPGRMRVLSGIKGSILIDDTYNSSPVAVESALQTLNEIKYAGRKIAVLGDMLELGIYSIEQHRRMGELVPKVADILLTLGVRSREIAQAALDNGMPEANVFQYDDVGRAGRELQAMLQPGDVVLIKASQAIRAERVVEEVMLEPERASELLVRQDAAWQRR